MKLIAVFLIAAHLLSVSLVVAFPGEAFLHPTIHFTPSYVSDKGGWHDVAGAITHNGVHHIYQGTGWNHAQSVDLVHWKTGPHGPAAIHETYAGMDSTSDPCSGFITKDPLDNGRVCAGFRQCGSHKGRFLSARPPAEAERRALGVCDVKNIYGFIKYTQIRSARRARSLSLRPQSTVPQK